MSFAKWGNAKPSRKSIIGLDVDDKFVKLVELKKSLRGFTLTNYAISEITPSSPDEDEITSASNTIRKLVERLSIDPSDVYLSVSGPGVSIRRINVPVMPEDELFGAVRWESKNLIPFPLDTATLDYYVIGKILDKGVEKLDVIVVAAQDKVINHQIKIVETAGLKASGITVNPFALWDILKRNITPQVDEVVALIDIGDKASSINLFKNNILQFTREISVAGESITKALTGITISDQMQQTLTYEQAEKIKINYGIPHESSVEKTPEGITLTQIHEAMKPALRRMVNEILRSFDYYKEQFRETKISKVFITGGSSRLKNLEEYLSSGLGIKVEIANPLAGIDLDLKKKASAEEVRTAAPILTLALGLAMGEASTLNLIHIKRPAKKEIEIKKFFEALRLPAFSWISIAVVVLMLAAGHNLYLARQVDYYRTEVHSKRAILSDLKTLNERREIVARISKEESHLRETLNKFNTTIPYGIILTKLDYVNASRTIDAHGTSLNVNLIGNFLKTIERSPYFSRARLIESRKGLQEKGNEMGFHISFHVD